MPAPAEGYPDWLRVDQVVGPILYHGTAIPITAQRTIGPFYVGSYTDLRVSGYTDIGLDAYRIEVQFFTDEACTLFAGARAFHMTDPLAFLDLVPIAGAWAKILVSASAYPAGQLNLDVQPMRGVGRGARWVDDNVLGSETSVTVNAGLTKTIQLSPIVTGPCVLAVITDRVDWTARVTAHDWVGVARHICNANGGGGRAGEVVRFVAPPHELHVTLYAGAGNTVWEWSVVAEDD